LRFIGLLTVICILQGCGSLAKGPRNSYSFSLTVTNDSEYVVRASISYNDNSTADECSKSGDSSSAEVQPGESKQVSISTLCHVEPSSSASVSFPADAGLETKNYMFPANIEVICSNSGCQAK
jgi:hypothetical protein